MIHRYWHHATFGVPPAEPWLHHVIANLHPDDTVRDWTDDTLPPALVARLAVDPLGTNPRHRANVVRWWLLEHHSGVWLDHDVIPLMPLPRGAWTAALTSTRCACAVRLPAGHALPRAMLDAIDATPRTATSSPVDVSGDRLLTRVAAAWPRLGSQILPFDAAGRPVRGVIPWAVHLWATSSRTRLATRS